MKNIFTLLLLALSISAGAQSGITWGMGMNIASSSTGNDHPRVVMDASGNPLVLWGHSNRAMFSRWNGTAFTAPVMLNPMTMMIAHASWMGPDIAAHGDTVYVVFKQMPEADTSSHIYIIRSFDGGMTFSMPVQVDSPADTVSRFPTVTTDPLGNPIVAFMNFNSGFGNAQWAVAKSTDFGNTFSPSVRASGWSSGTSTVCDCCPGAIESSGSNVAVLYRDNNSDIRDSWAGLSTDGGATFTAGWNIDQNNWLIMNCPATGPDGVIIGDSLYSVFLNGNSGNRVYKSVSSISAMAAAAPSQMITGSITGLASQNYPRIAHYGNAVAMVWKQYVSGADQLPVYFTNDISNGFPANYDTVDLGFVVNTDVAVGNGSVVVVWEDENSGTVKYRSGTFTPVTSVGEIAENNIHVYPNPAENKFTIYDSRFTISGVEVSDALGRKVFSNQTTTSKQLNINVDGWNAGIYFVRVQTEKGTVTRKVIVQ